MHKSSYHEAPFWNGLQTHGSSGNNLKSHKSTRFFSEDDYSGVGGFCAGNFSRMIIHEIGIGLKCTALSLQYCLRINRKVWHGKFCSKRQRIAFLRLTWRGVRAEPKLEVHLLFWMFRLVWSLLRWAWSIFPEKAFFCLYVVIVSAWPAVNVWTSLGRATLRSAKALELALSCPLLCQSIITFSLTCQKPLFTTLLPRKRDN